MWVGDEAFGGGVGWCGVVIVDLCGWRVERGCGVVGSDELT